MLRNPGVGFRAGIAPRRAGSLHKKKETLLATMQSRKKIFVLDTNVILHDSSCIYQFEEHDVVIPITVVEELDQFKKGNGTLNYHAREFVRAIDSLSGDKLFDGGVKIGPKQGRLMVKLEREFHERLRSNFSRRQSPTITFSTSATASQRRIPGAR